MLRSRPIVVILGSTGVGKTRLSCELAQRFAGEIISADSMQVYRGLDIATAKATPAERAVAPHHLLDVAQPGRPYTVVDFRDAALPIVERLLAESEVVPTTPTPTRMPIVVGGTNYYIESLLWRVLVAPPTTTGDKRRRDEWQPTERSDDDHDSESAAKRAHRDTDGDRERSAEQRRVATLDDAALAAMASDELHTLLQSVDPEQAARLHPNNRRKSIRALQIYRDCGQPMSAVLAAQQREPGGSSLGGPLRYAHCILLWLRCSEPVLERRLDARIDAMVQQGLLAEIRAFYERLERGTDATAPPVYTKGILQTIGFKEFIPYLERHSSETDARITEYMRTANAAEADAPEGLALLRSCLDELRLVTKRYAKKQLKWVSNRFCAANARQVPPVYALDTSSVADWQTEVLDKAVDIIESYRADRSCSVRPIERVASRRGDLDEGVSHRCAVCERTFVGEFQWRIHLRSNKHKRAAERRKRAAETAKCEVVVVDGSGSQPVVSTTVVE